MSRVSDPATDDWIDQARSVSVQEAAARLGAKLRKKGAAEWDGPCPNCQGHDRFSINTVDNVFNCRGAVGGDAIAMTMHVMGLEFMAACEWLNESPPPGRGTVIDQEEVARRRLEAQARREAQDQERYAKEQRDIEAAMRSSEALFSLGVPIDATHAMAYLAARNLSPTREQCRDLRFLASLPYRGFRTPDADSDEDLGSFPAMLAAIRNSQGVIIGVHRTYLDPREPKKLTPPGSDPRRNKAKKVFGKMAGGAIWLSPVRSVMAVSEGIETGLAWLRLGLGGDLGLCTAVSLGNMSGGCTGTLAHPSGNGKRIQNGIPDLDRPGIVLPGDVREIILLGDGDSDPATTKAHLLTAVRRFAAQERAVSVSMAPEGMDWADYIMANGEAAE